MPTRALKNRSSFIVHRSAFIVLLIAVAAIAQEPAKEQKPEKPVEQKDPSDLGERLVRKALTDSSEDVMAEILRLMGESSRRLDADFDAGDQTQAVQKRVMERLDEAIKQAAAQLRQQKQSPSQQKSDKRKQEQAGKEQQKKKEQSQGSDPTADPDASNAENKGEAAETKLPGGDMTESRRAWGQLPQRDRDEVIQGKNEQFLERYRQLIDQYFRALQGAEEGPK